MFVIAQTAPALSARRTQAPLRSKRSPAARPARSLQQIRAQKIDNDYFSDSRRAVLLSGTALAANLCMPEFWMPPANAKKIISGSNPAAPGVTCAFLSHGTFPTQTVATASNIPLTDRSSFLSSGTPDFDAWYKIYEGAMNNLTGDMASIFRAVCAKGADGGVNAVIVFPSEYTKGIQAFYDQKKNPLWEGGRKDGWLTGDFQQVYFTPTAFRGAVEGPPPPGKGNGVTLCASGESLVSFVPARATRMTTCVLFNRPLRSLRRVVRGVHLPGVGPDPRQVRRHRVRRR